jgi:hypothetical protein
MLSVMPTVIKTQVGYLDSEALLAIFNSDRKSANLYEERSDLLEKMNDDSDGEDREGVGDDLFIEDKPRETFRYYVLDLDELGMDDDDDDAVDNLQDI